MGSRTIGEQRPSLAPSSENQSLLRAENELSVKVALGVSDTLACITPRTILWQDSAGVRKRRPDEDGAIESSMASESGFLALA